MHVCGHMKPSDIYKMIQNTFPCKQQNQKYLWNKFGQYVSYSQALAQMNMFEHEHLLIKIFLSLLSRNIVRPINWKLQHGMNSGEITANTPQIIYLLTFSYPSPQFTREACELRFCKAQQIPGECYVSKYLAFLPVVWRGISVGLTTCTANWLTGHKIIWFLQPYNNKKEHQPSSFSNTKSILFL